jgi:hypothetical protein
VCGVFTSWFVCLAVLWLLVPACGFLLLELDFGFALDSISFFLARLLMTDD